MSEVPVLFPEFGFRSEAHSEIVVFNSDGTFITWEA